MAPREERKSGPDYDLLTGRSLSAFLVANARHDVSNDELHVVGWHAKRIALRNNSDRLAGTVHDHLADLAFVQVLLEAGPEFRIGHILQVVTELGQKISATEHRGSSSQCE